MESVLPWRFTRSISSSSPCMKMRRLYSPVSASVCAMRHALKLALYLLELAFVLPAPGDIAQ
ncbi:MAG: hypothetical protein QF515_09035 [Pseudomonadales bacterium]|jgi:hypothetical protein|nr:hypothetical protein [Pseudomonadales bacterium]|tara:strand:+ start:692 stop:877 length:186 start_codon:yes stop_codon:yes gene_type:complete